MKLLFEELYVFSPQEKTAKRLQFGRDINVITSSQKDGTKRGKSVLMRSIYHTMGAEAIFDRKWDTDSKIYIIKLTIDDSEFFLYRFVGLFKFFDKDKKLLFRTTRSQELAEKLFQYTHFAVQLPDRTNQRLEITPPVFNYLLNYLDQDEYKGTRFSSFRKLGQYKDFKDNVVFYHLGVYDENYFALIKEREKLVEEQKTKLQRSSLLKEMQNRVEHKLVDNGFSSDIESLEAEVSLSKREYTTLLTKLRDSKQSLMVLRNTEFEIEQLMGELESFSKKIERETTLLRGHRCPECNSFLTENIVLLSRKYNLNEEVVLLRSQYESTLLELSTKIQKEELNYQLVLNQLHDYEDRIQYSTHEISDALRFRGYSEMRDEILAERNELLTSLDEIQSKLSDLKKKLRKYTDKKKRINEDYSDILMEAHSRFGINEISPDLYKDIKNNFDSSGSNRPIVTIMWYLALTRLRRKYNEASIIFPIVFDSPNNVETDDEMRHELIQFIFDTVNRDEQVILSSIGFDALSYQTDRNINIIKLENNKYSVLDHESYVKYYDLLSCFANADNI